MLILFLSDLVLLLGTWTLSSSFFAACQCRMPFFEEKLRDTE